MLRNFSQDTLYKFKEITDYDPDLLALNAFDTVLEEFLIFGITRVNMDTLVEYFPEKQFRLMRISPQESKDAVIREYISVCAILDFFPRLTQVDWDLYCIHPTVQDSPGNL